MDESRLALDHWEQSASAWIAGIDQGEANRVFLLDAAMLALCGNVQGKLILDVGCGEGRFSRMLAERGACVTGVEPTPSMRKAAVERHPEGRYVDAVAESLPFEDNSFDLAIYYLVLIDIADHRQAIREAFRVLRPGGEIVVANVQSFGSCGRWKRDEEGQPLYRTIDRYFEERGEHLKWGGIEIYNWHRPLECYMSGFLEAGFQLRKFGEPRPDPDMIDRHPKMETEARVPNFLTMVWRKE
jgi:SAM-dependent methyltransferase